MQQAQAANQRLVHVTAEIQSINAELIDVVSSRDQSREQAELRSARAEATAVRKEAEYKERVAFNSCAGSREAVTLQPALSLGDVRDRANSAWMITRRHEKHTKTPPWHEKYTKITKPGNRTSDARVAPRPESHTTAD